MLRGAVGDGRAPIILASPSVTHKLEEIACSSAKCIQPKGMTPQPGGIVAQPSIVPHGIRNKCMDKKRLEMWTCVPFRCFCCRLCGMLPLRSGQKHFKCSRLSGILSSLTLRLGCLIIRRTMATWPAWDSWRFSRLIRDCHFRCRWVRYHNAFAVLTA